MTKGRSLRSQQRSFTQDRFIDAALEVFEDVGFHDATIDMITKKAGANRSTFYLHFKDKSSLMLAAQDRLTPSAKEAFEFLDEIEDPTFKDLRRWIDYMAKVWEERPQVYAAVIQAQLFDPSIAKQNYDTICDNMSNHLNRFKGKKKAEARRRLEMFCMQFELYFYTTICECAEKPAPDALDTLADLGLYALYNKTRN